MRKTRLADMKKLIAERGTVSMFELCSLFDISMNTARRDVSELQRQGVLEKVYGGVTATPEKNSVLRSYEERKEVAHCAKRAICQKAASLVEDGDVIFADSGTTLEHLPEYLGDRKDVIIVTNNLALVQNAIPFENLTIIVLPGQLRRKTNSLTGMETVRSIKQFNIKKVFMAATGASIRGVTNSSPQEYEIKRTAIDCAATRILLMAHEKFGQSGLMTYAEFSDFDMIITDREIPALFSEAIANAQVTVMTAR